MKRLCFAIIVLLALGGGIFFFRYVRESSVSVMSSSGNSSTAQSDSKVNTFRGKAGEGIRIEYTADIQGGFLNLTLTDSTGNIIKSLEGGGKFVEEIVLEKSDEYSMRISLDKFIGSYCIFAKK